MAPSSIQVCPQQTPSSTEIKYGHSNSGHRVKKGPPEPKEVPESFAEDYWMSPTTARIPCLPQLKEMLAQGGKAKECLAAAQTQKKSVEEILAASKDRWLRRLKMGFNLLIEGGSSLKRKTGPALSLTQDLCDKYMDPKTFRTYLGGVAESTELLARKWDHIFYTGNGVIGRIVMTAAAKHLCPVTLELGGKSPVIVDRGLSPSQLHIACSRIISTALFVNAGQICVSPDYVLVHEDAEQQLIEALKAAVARMTPENSEKLGKVVNSRHFARLRNLAETAEGQVVCGGAAAGEPNSCFLPPTIISRPSLTSPAMTEELFGPLLMVTPVKSLEEAADFVNSRETPLALYVFSGNRKRAEDVIRNTRSGGAMINDTFVHLANPHLPFGGCGESGFGSYHGKWGFDEFSHKRSVLARPLFLDIDRYPPYDNLKLMIVRTAMTVPEMIKSFAAKMMRIFGC